MLFKIEDANVLSTIYVTSHMVLDNSCCFNKRNLLQPSSYGMKIQTVTWLKEDNSIDVISYPLTSRCNTHTFRM